MKTKIITLSLIGLLFTACGGGTDNGNVPTCDQLNSSQGKQIAKEYLIGSWVDEYENSWGMARFEFDGTTLKRWIKKSGERGYESTGTYHLQEVKKHRGDMGCSEYVFEFYTSGANFSVIVENMRGACHVDATGRNQYVHYK